jgi:hypothetical protein
MGKKTSGGTTTTNQSSEPWKAIQPDLLNMYGLASQYGQTPGSFFPGQTYSQPAEASINARNMQTQRAMNGSPVTDAMQGELTGVLGGQYLDAGNPHFGAMADRITNKVTQGMNSTFGGTGRFGSGAHANALASELTSGIGALGYQNYNDERGRMMQGLSLAPAAANQDYIDIAALRDAGGQWEDNEQKFIDDQMARHNFSQAEPWERLGNWSNILQGGLNFGTQTGTTRAPTQRSSLGGDLLGAGVLAAAVPWGSIGSSLGGFGKTGASPATSMAGPGGMLGGRV